MGFILLLFGVSIGLIAAPFIVERFLFSTKASPKDVFPHDTDNWTTRVSKLREGKNQFSDFRRVSKRTYKDEYK